MKLNSCVFHGEKIREDVRVNKKAVFSTIPAVFPHVPPRPDADMSYRFRLPEVLHLLIELKKYP